MSQSGVAVAINDSARTSVDSLAVERGSCGGRLPTIPGSPSRGGEEGIDARSNSHDNVSLELAHLTAATEGTAVQLAACEAYEGPDNSLPQGRSANVANHPANHPADVGAGSVPSAILDAIINQSRGTDEGGLHIPGHAPAHATGSPRTSGTLDIFRDSVHASANTSLPGSTGSLDSEAPSENLVPRTQLAPRGTLQ